MQSSPLRLAGAAGLALALGAPFASAQDWSMWGGDETRNMAAAVKGLPADFVVGEFERGTDRVDLSTTKNVKWVAKLGSQTYGNPTVANGRVYVGTNNDSPRDPRFEGDRSTVYCLSEETGEFLWQLAAPKLGTGKVSDWEYIGICCSPTVDGDRVYIVTNRCEVMCLDVNGMADGNQGYQDEGLYLAWPETEPMEVAKTDADILWVFNMMEECGVFPHNITTSSVLVSGDQLWVSSSNGIDYGHAGTPAPDAPSLILLDKNTGELLAEEASGCSARMFHANWSSPAYLRTDETEACIFGGPDGQVYAFDPAPIEGPDGRPILNELWRADVNPAEYREKDGEPIMYTDRDGPSEVLATPVVYGDRVYALIGQDPEHGPGVGNLACIDAKGQQVWNYAGINRSLSTLAIADDLVFAADFSGFVYCLDANTGEEYWVYDTKGHIWASTFVADGRVFIGNEDGFLTILPASKDAKPKKEGREDRPARPLGPIVEVDMVSPVYASAIAANGTLYIATHTHLYAIAAPEGGDDQPEDAPTGGR
ncbi:MAG: PQQ-binding-like beta-propeller repeat protein [Planctomycetota bacterium]